MRDADQPLDDCDHVGQHGHGLTDEVLLLVYPILLGPGKRFFSDGATPRELALVGTKAASSGVVISTYRPSGALRTGSFDDVAA